MQAFKKPLLYVIVDSSVLRGRDPCGVAEAAIQGGADVIQWRDKLGNDADFLSAAQRLRKITKRFTKTFIVNDRVAIALLVKADGVHVGQEDLPIPAVRRLVGNQMLIGQSTHSLSQAKEAQEAGADYIGVGPIFRTPTKPDYPIVGLQLIRQVKKQIHIPWVAIGGIDLERVALVLSAGACRIAVVRAVAGARNPKKAADVFKKMMQKEDEWIC